MAVVADYEIEFDGIKISDNANLSILDFDPFSMPEVRSSDKIRGLDDGLFPGTDYLGGRTINLVVEVAGEDQASFYTAYKTLMDACRKTPDNRLLEFRLPSWPEVIRANARVRRFNGLNINTAFDLGGPVAANIQFYCSDPRLYSSAEQSATVGIQGTQSGRTYNLTFNRSFGGLVASNIIVANNGGNYDAPWSARIDGPVTNPSIESVSQSKTLRIIGSIGVGEFLEVHSSPYKTIMLGGTATRYSWLADSTQWFLLSPGNNDIRFNGSSAGAPTMTFSWRSTWT